MGLEIIVLHTFLATSPFYNIMLQKMLWPSLVITRAVGHTVKYTSLHLYKTSSIKIMRSYLFMLTAKCNVAVLTLTNQLKSESKKVKNGPGKLQNIFHFPLEV